MISDVLGPGKINKVPEQEAITMKAFKVGLFFLILCNLESSLGYHSISIFKSFAIHKFFHARFARFYIQDDNAGSGSEFFSGSGPQT